MANEADHEWMQEALGEAARAFEAGEVPVGAVVVFDGRVVGRGRNRKESGLDPTAHAEIIAIRQAAAELGRWRLSGCTLYATLEPCPMCIGAMLSARIDQLVFGCRDPKAGAVRSLFELAADSRLNHRIEVREGIGAEQAAELLRSFFRLRRCESKMGNVERWPSG
ncbi:MAG TPA: tRNA adenosine(34) deaminase TadA [Myxococcota bacterium]|nr:tRNA adenosine(34) deaminase TadA [Myxococcota bacterium]